MGLIKISIKIAAYVLLVSVFTLSVLTGRWIRFKGFPLYEEVVESNHVPFTELESEYKIEPNRIYYRNDTYTVKIVSERFPFIKKERCLIRSEVISKPKYES